MKALDKRQKRLLMGILGAVALIAVILLIPLLAPDGDERGEQHVGVIPEADLDEDEDSKTDSYRKGGSINDYWDSLEGESGDLDAPESPARDSGGVSARDGRRPPAVVVDDLFGDYQGQRTEPGKGESRPKSPKPKAQAGKASSVPVADEKPAPEPPAEEPRRVPIAKRSGAVSSLDEDVATDLGNGFSTLDGTDQWVGSEVGKPYRCMFTRDEKVGNGERITVRLLEDLVVGGVHIPRNTHLQGVVTISERLEVSITSLDVGGRILSFRFEAYDTDGGKGIYCSDLGKVRKEATDQGLSTVSSSLNSRLGKVARDVASVGASIIRSKSGETTVKVPAGYTFYIIEEPR